ncbi:MAG: nitrous oxide reductase accessory protein NosL [Bacteroidota bacterium]|jgi:copper chaperone NosL
MKSVISIFSVFIALIIISGCGKSPVPLEIGKDECNYCKMTIVDPKWGAEIITDKGKIYKFDVVECAIAYAETELKEGEKVKSVWTVNYLNPKEFLSVENALYLFNEQFHSPMGMDAVSVPVLKDTSKLKLSGESEILNWDNLKKKTINKLKED